MRNRTHGAAALRDLAASGNALADGAAIAFLAVVTGVLAIPARSLAARSNIFAGGTASALGMALLMRSGARRAGRFLHFRRAGTRPAIGLVALLQAVAIRW